MTNAWFKIIDSERNAVERRIYLWKIILPNNSDFKH